MKKNALIIMAFAILSKVLGLLRDLGLSYIYGASNVSDAYLISLTVPGVIFTFVATSIATGYIPMYSSILKKTGESEGLKFTNNLINIVALLCTVIVIITYLFTDQIVMIFASGFEGEALRLASNFTRILIIGIYFTGTVSILSGFIQLKGNYVIPAFIGIPLNIFFIISIFLSLKFNLMLLAIGSLIAYVSQLVFLLTYLKKFGYKYELYLDFKDSNIQKMVMIGLPIIIGSSINQINILVDRNIASQLIVGGISALNYANRLNLFVQGIFVTSIATVIFPMMSKKTSNNDANGFKLIISEAINSVNILVIPSTIGFLLFSYEIVTLLFGRGVFDIAAIELTSLALFYYSIGMMGFGLREVLSRAFYSMHDTKTPVKNAALGMILNIILNIILSRYLGIGGLALATSIAAIFTTILLFVSLRKKIGPFGMKQISISFLKILFASLAMGGLAKLSFNYLTTSLSQNLSLLIAIGVGAVSYFVIIYFMKIEDVDVIVGAIKKKLGRGAT
ncbi:murein biosynthesis integral membrane protein MurJ [Alkaliphilus pronyensis]|uniref:Probable lipid II flippase MurJ n=1 Tax=Alkaliphilus pronyensis TaxID=1482732 RepID=A0A6I0F846_9FIRM|nr:murein biosynthesis integral membrane protein MurJ [Alkaliphilus pronyensis]KAB3534733.1 murein biosynthesis integral membrane protein MurJ [Alkaliphilus pronyensis]